MEDAEVMEEFVKFNNALGRKALLHNSIKVVGAKKSIQGEWRDNMWSQYPRHTLEIQRETPYQVVEPEQPVEVKPLGPGTAAFGAVAGPDVVAAILGISFGARESGFACAEFFKNRFRVPVKV